MKTVKYMQAPMEILSAKTDPSIESQIIEVSTSIINALNEGNDDVTFDLIAKLSLDGITNPELLNGVLDQLIKDGFFLTSISRDKYKIAGFFLQICEVADKLEMLSLQADETGVNAITLLIVKPFKGDNKEFFLEYVKLLNERDILQKAVELPNLMGVSLVNHVVLKGLTDVLADAIGLERLLTLKNYQGMNVILVAIMTNNSKLLNKVAENIEKLSIVNDEVLKIVNSYKDGPLHLAGRNIKFIKPLVDIVRFVHDSEAFTRENTFRDTPLSKIIKGSFESGLKTLKLSEEAKEINAIELLSSASYNSTIFTKMLAPNSGGVSPLRMIISKKLNKLLENIVKIAYQIGVLDDVLKTSITDTKTFADLIKSNIQISALIEKLKAGDATVEDEPAIATEAVVLKEALSPSPSPASTPSPSEPRALEFSPIDASSDLINQTIAKLANITTEVVDQNKSLLEDKKGAEKTIEFAKKHYDIGAIIADFFRVASVLDITKSTELGTDFLNQVAWLVNLSPEIRVGSKTDSGMLEKVIPSTVSAMTQVAQENGVAFIGDVNANPPIIVETEVALHEPRTPEDVNFDATLQIADEENVISLGKEYATSARNVRFEGISAAPATSLELSASQPGTAVSKAKHTFTPVLARTQDSVGSPGLALVDEVQPVRKVHKHSSIHGLRVALSILESADLSPLERFTKQIIAIHSHAEITEQNRFDSIKSLLTSFLEDYTKDDVKTFTGDVLGKLKHSVSAAEFSKQSKMTAHTHLETACSEFKGKILKLFDKRAFKARYYHETESEEGKCQEAVKKHLEQYLLPEVSKKGIKMTPNILDSVKKVRKILLSKEKEADLPASAAASTQPKATSVDRLMNELEIKRIELLNLADTIKTKHNLSKLKAELEFAKASVDKARKAAKPEKERALAEAQKAFDEAVANEYQVTSARLEQEIRILDAKIEKLNSNPVRDLFGAKDSDDGQDFDESPEEEAGARSESERPIHKAIGRGKPVSNDLEMNDDQEVNPDAEGTVAADSVLAKRPQITQEEEQLRLNNEAEKGLIIAKLSELMGNAAYIFDKLGFENVSSYLSNGYIRSALEIGGMALYCSVVPTPTNYLALAISVMKFMAHEFNIKGGVVTLIDSLSPIVLATGSDIAATVGVLKSLIWISGVFVGGIEDPQSPVLPFVKALEAMTESLSTYAVLSSPAGSTIKIMEIADYSVDLLKIIKGESPYIQSIKMFDKTKAKQLFYSLYAENFEEAIIKPAAAVVSLKNQAKIICDVSLKTKKMAEEYYNGVFKFENIDGIKEIIEQCQVLDSTSGEAVADNNATIVTATGFALFSALRGMDLDQDNFGYNFSTEALAIA